MPLVRLDANDIASLDDGDPIDSWPAGDGATVGAVKTTDAQRPTKQTVSINGIDRPVARFLHAPNNHQLAFSGGPITLNDFTAFFVVRLNVGSTNQGALLGRHNGGGPQVRVRQSGDVLSTYDGTNNPTSSTLSTSPENWSILGFRRSGTTVTYYQDGSAFGTGTMLASDDNGRLFSRIGNIAGAVFLNTDMADSVVYDEALSDGAVVAEFNALSAKWFDAEPVDPVVAGTCSASLTSQWEATINCTGATGGVAPYSAQVQRAADDGDGNPTGSWTNVGSAQTGLAAEQAITPVVEDVTALQTQVVHYRVLWTDDEAESIASNSAPVLIRTGTTYYIDATGGNDSNDGLSQGTAWQTISKVNAWRATRGDSFLFKGGETFAGNLRLRLAVGGVLPAAGERCRVGVSGEGKAKITAGESYGVWVDSLPYTTVEDMEAEGPGVTFNAGSPNTVTFGSSLATSPVRVSNAGVWVTNSNGEPLAGVIVRNNLCHGLTTGIQIGGHYNHGSAADFGTEGLLVEDNHCFENLRAGISLANGTDKANDDIHLEPVLQRNFLYDNYGDWNGTVGAFDSGFGILCWNSIDPLVRWNVIVNNGAACKNGVFLGPTGILLAFCQRETLDEHVIENIVAAQHTQDAADGMGIDVETKVSGIRVRRNYVVDCDGAGLAYGDVEELGDSQDIEFSYNVVQNCGRKHLNGFIRQFNHVSSAGIKCFNNTYFCDLPGVPAFEGDDRGMSVRNNVLIFRNGATFGTLHNSNALTGNLYDFASGSTFSVTYNGTHTSIAALRAAGGEMVGGNPVGIEGPAGLLNPGGGPTGDFMIDSRPDEIDAYDPADESAVIGAGLDLATLFGYDVGSLDFRGGSNTTGGDFSIGAVTAAEADETPPVLSNPTAAATGQTTADLSVDTDEGNGTLYAVVTTSETTPSAEQVKAGQDHTGGAAAFADSQGVSSTGTKTFSATGLTAETTYWSHFMHEDAAENQSTVVTSASFETEGEEPPPPFDGLSGTCRLFGTPVAGAKLTLINSDTDSPVATATSGLDGTYSFERPAAGTYHVAGELEVGGTKYNAKSLPFIEVTE